jgi:hypothetical protein
MAKANQGGHPRKPHPEQRCLLQVRSRTGHLALWKKAAEAAGLGLSSWVRSRLIDAAKREAAKRPSPQ